MSNFSTFLLEFVRVLLILLAGLFFLFSIESTLFMITPEGTAFALLLIANVLLILVFYRNKLQFHGWYKGKEVKKLPAKTTRILTFSAFIAILLAL